MSKVWKGVKKVFKKVVKVVKKVAPIVLAAAAVYFTAGAALGVTSATGGWTAMAGKVGGLFGEGALASTVTGAVYSAGVGAAVGGGVSAAMGGSFSEGAQRGAAVGAVTGGIGGYLGHTPIAEIDTSTLPQPRGMPTTPQPTAPAPAFNGPYAPGYDPSAPLAGVGPEGQMLGDIPPAGGAPVAPAPAPAAAPAPITAPGGLDQTPTGTAGIGRSSMDNMLGPDAASGAASGGNAVVEGIKKVGGNILGKDGWLQNNQTLAGGAIQGIGMGMAANAEVEGNLEYLQKRQDLISANYEGVDPGRNYRKLAGSSSRQDRYDPRSYGSWEYQYDPAQGRIIKVPVGG